MMVPHPINVPVDIVTYTLLGGVAAETSACGAKGPPR